MPEQVHTPVLSTPRERRRAPRYPLIALADLIDLQTEAHLQGRTSDLSLIGCYVDIPAALPLGAKVRVRIEHDGATFTSPGVIAHCQPGSGMGINFTDTPLDQREVLENWIAALVRDWRGMASPETSETEEPFVLLVVDDSPVAHKLIEHALPPERFRLLQATTGLEALDLFASHRPGLVITDWAMPDLSGIDLCQRLRADFRSTFVYVILLTSNSEKPNIGRGLQAGADDYLTKPFDAQELLARVNVGRKSVELHRQLEAKNRFLEELALTDVLTGLPNRRAVEQWGMRQISGALRHKFPFWVVMADLDGFKSINDTHGHEAGDIALRKLGEILKATTRRCDICGRIGGDEFLLVVTHSEADGIRVAIERIRRQVEGQRFEFGDQSVSVTASFGIAGLDRDYPVDFARLVAQADVALQSAKRLGRNRIEMAAAGASEPDFATPEPL